ncbi:MAG: dihydroorotase [candidate division NC10 bacterium]|nr:dihydroorotase [candidate division NC10 bacterium]MCH7895539.1 dihydroorotase [candidate division NC10 bacterium]MCZ6549828.1 dihydroorotase [candidate division NC10 bacterium]
MRLLITGGRVIDPANGVDDILDVLVEEGQILQVGREGQGSGVRGQGKKNKKPGNQEPSTTNPDRVIDATGKIVIPGLIDMHVHLREPGREDEETIASGSAAAARGGFTSICCMPNTEPVNDTASVSEYIRELAQKAGRVNIFPIGCISKGERGQELAEIGELVAAGCVGFSDDGKPVADAELMRRAMEYATMFDVPLLPHCEDPSLSAGGVMHEGRVSTELGLKGIPSAAEAVMVGRDILLSEYTGARLHICHVSAAESVRLIREARARGVRVSGEATPHHLILTDEAVRGFHTNTKMNPPLRAAEDITALREALIDGTIEVIATDHAPHARSEKEMEFDYAPFGIIGLETALGLILTELYHSRLLTLPMIVERMAVNPARILKLKHKGTLAPGADADITVLDPDREWTVEERELQSKSKNSPFIGWKLKGKPVMTIVAGQVVWETT